MYIPSTIRTSFGPRAALPRCPMVRVSLTQAELHVLIRAIERDASSAEEEGRMSAADSLSWRVAALREAMR
jgi:hypothetical protein